MDDYISPSDFTPTATGYTFSTWIYPKRLVGDSGIVGKLRSGSSGDAYGFGIRLEGTNFQGLASNNNLAWKNNLNYGITGYLNKWVYLTFTITGTSGTQTGKLYVNGSEVDSYSDTAGFYNLYLLAIGTCNQGTLVAGFFNGSIDDVMIFNRTLSADEISLLYNNQLAGHNNILHSDATIKGETWKANVTVNDGIEDGTNLESEEITIQNTAPTAPTLSSPANNSYTNDNTLTLIWNDGSDIDSDSLNYYLEVWNDSSLSQIGYVNSSISETTTTTQDITSVLEDSDYYWRVLVNDGTDNSSFTDWFNLTVDTTYPEIYIISPEATTYGTTSINLNYNVVEANLDSIWYTKDLGITNTTLTVNITLPSIEDNSTYTITVYANDSASNENLSSVTFSTHVVPWQPSSNIVSVRQATGQSQEFYINVQAGQSELIGIADNAYIVFNQNRYDIDVKSILEDNVELKIGDNLIKIETGKSAYIDLNNDKLADLIIRLEAIIENRAQLYVKEVITEKEKEIIPKEEIIQVEKEAEKIIPVEKSLLRNYLDKLKVSFTKLFTSDVIKEIKAYPNIKSYLVIAVILIIIILKVFLRKKKILKKRL